MMKTILLLCASALYVLAQSPRAITVTSPAVSSMALNPAKNFLSMAIPLLSKARGALSWRTDPLC